jgi:hypothetical protein
MTDRPAGTGQFLPSSTGSRMRGLAKFFGKFGEPSTSGARSLQTIGSRAWRSSEWSERFSLRRHEAFPLKVSHLRGAFPEALHWSQASFNDLHENCRCLIR